MNGASDLMPSAQLATIKLDGQTYKVREADLAALAKTEQTIMDLAYEAVEAMPEGERKDAALARLDAKYIEGGAHKFMGSAFDNRFKNLDVFRILLWCCTNTAVDYHTFAKLLNKDASQFKRMVRAFMMPFFTLAMERDQLAMEMREKLTSEVLEPNLAQLGH